MRHRTYRTLVVLVGALVLLLGAGVPGTIAQTTDDGFTPPVMAAIVHADIDEAPGEEEPVAELPSTGRGTAAPAADSFAVEQMTLTIIVLSSAALLALGVLGLLSHWERV